MWTLDWLHDLLETDEVLPVVRQGRRTGADVADITYEDGVAVAATPAVTFDIVCTVQPAGGRDLMMLPEAFRTKDSLSIWQAHRTAEQDVVRLEVSDVVLFRGQAFQVQSAQDWESFTKGTMVGIDIGPYQGELDPANLPALYPVAATKDTTIVPTDPLSMVP